MACRGVCRQSEYEKSKKRVLGGSSRKTRMSAGARASMIILHAVDDYAAGAAARARARAARPTHRLHRLGAQNAERSPSLKRKWNSSAVADGSSERNVRRSLGLPFLDFPFHSQRLAHRFSPPSSLHNRVRDRYLTLIHVLYHEAFRGTGTVIRSPRAPDFLSVTDDCSGGTLNKSTPPRILAICDRLTLPDTIP